MCMSRAEAEPSAGSRFESRSVQLRNTTWNLREEVRAGAASVEMGIAFLREIILKLC